MPERRGIDPPRPGESGRDEPDAADELLAVRSRASLLESGRRLGRIALKLRRPLLFLLTHPHKLPRLAGRAWALYRNGSLRAVDERLETLERYSSGAYTARAYRRWRRDFEALTPAQRRCILEDIAAFDDPPLISILMPVYDTRPKWLNKAIRSVMRQSYPHWELCIADDHSQRAATRRVLRAWQRRDARIAVCHRNENGHISRASNSALTLASGDFVALLDHDDELPRDALYHVACEIRAHPDVALIYSDEDKIDTWGRRYGHYFKPDYNPELLLSHNMISHLGVYRRDVVEAVGGFRVGLEGSQDYDLALRVIEHAGAHRIRHIPRILYHWRAIPQSAAARGLEAKPYTLIAAQRAVTEHLERTGRPASVEESGLARLNLRVRPRLPDPPPRVNILIACATQDAARGLDAHLERLRRWTDYPDYRFLVVHPDALPPPTEVAATLACSSSAPAALLNRAAHAADGELLLFLHRDCVPEGRSWLREMTAFGCLEGVGAVGAKLFDAEGRILHAGLLTCLRDVPGLAMRGLPRSDPGYNARAMLIQNYSALSAACLLIGRSAFEAAGGFDEASLPDGLYDIDLCLRLLEQGRRNVWMPHAALRIPAAVPEMLVSPVAAGQRDVLRSRWPDFMARDPAYSPNLTRRRTDFSLRGS